MIRSLLENLVHLQTIDKVVHLFVVHFFLEVRVCQLLLTLPVKSKVVYFGLTRALHVLVH